MSFYVGQKVVCVDGAPSRNPNPRLATKNRVIKGRIYTIRGFDTEAIEVGLLLEGLIDRIVPPWKQECGWDPNRFRPLHQHKTDISIFTEILKKTKVPVAVT